MYGPQASAEIYRNYMDWLFQTFDEDQSSFRSSLLSKLKPQEGNKVLITGCGFGDDIPPILNAIGPHGAVYANDFAMGMVVAASHDFFTHQANMKNVFLSVCNAQSLPFEDHYFDRAFHFGGINLCDNMRAAIDEMERVVKPGGRVVFGDEGVAPWLRTFEFRLMAINNNSLWQSTAPLNLLPRLCVDVQRSWVPGNCFYVIDFEVSASGPFMNPDMVQKGRRVGSMRTRYSGQLEGVTEESKKFVLEDAAAKGMSVYEWLENCINKKKIAGKITFHDSQKF